MPDQSPSKDLLRFHYLKNGNFRAIHVDGAIGAVQPTGKGIHLAMYTERTAIPQQVDHTLGADGVLGPEIEGSRVSRQGVVREFEIDAFMDLPTAASLQELLGSLLKQAGGIT